MVHRVPERTLMLWIAFEFVSGRRETGTVMVRLGVAGWKGSPAYVIDLTRTGVLVGSGGVKGSRYSTLC